jgi:hypothetical protein
MTAGGGFTKTGGRGATAVHDGLYVIDGSVIRTPLVPL